MNKNYNKIITNISNAPSKKDAIDMYKKVISLGLLDENEIKKLDDHLTQNNLIPPKITNEKYKTDIQSFINSYFTKYNINVLSNGSIKFNNDSSSYENASNEEYFVNVSIDKIVDREDTLKNEMYSDSNIRDLGFSKQQLNSVFDAKVHQLTKIAMKNELSIIFKNECHDINKRYEFFYNIADIVSLDNTEIHALILMKLFGQIKNKLLKRYQPVSHIMPIFYGSQGAGKSFFVKNLLSGLGSFTSPATFKEIDDKRGYTKYINNAVLVFDEMERASSTDINTIKNFVTSETIPVRPMGENKVINLDNNLTLVGTTNELIEDIFRDPTGNRRFVQFNYGSKEYEQPFLDPRFKTIDFTKIWDMSHCEDDNVFHIMGKEKELKKFVEKHSYKDPVKRFLSDDTNFRNLRDEWKSATAYYECFISWCDDEGITQKMIKNTFCKKLKISIDKRFENKIKNKQEMYCFIGDKSNG